MVSTATYWRRPVRGAHSLVHLLGVTNALHRILTLCITSPLNMVSVRSNDPASYVFIPHRPGNLPGYVPRRRALSLCKSCTRHPHLFLHPTPSQNTVLSDSVAPDLVFIRPYSSYNFFIIFFSYRGLAATQTKPCTFTPCTTRPCPARLCYHQISGLPDKAALLPVRPEPHPPNSPCKHPCLFHLFSSSFPQTPRGLPFVPCAASSPRLAWPRPARPSLTVPCSRHRGDALIAQSLDNISSLPFR